MIDVAEPLLLRSPALRDDHLEPIARTQSQEHLLVIAQRKTLSERLTDILVERGNEEVAGTVTGNEGARFSEAGFEWLAGRASASEAILNRLVRSPRTSCAPCASRSRWGRRTARSVLPSIRWSPLGWPRPRLA